VGHPYIASLWLGSLLGKLSAPKHFAPQLLALLCQLNLCINKKGIVIYMSIFMFEGVNAIQGICLVFHGSHSNNREHT
jgi:hypothetical protein